MALFSRHAIRGPKRLLGAYATFLQQGPRAMLKLSGPRELSPLLDHLLLDLTDPAIMQLSGMRAMVLALLTRLAEMAVQSRWARGPREPFSAHRSRRLLAALEANRGARTVACEDRRALDRLSRALQDLPPI